MPRDTRTGGVLENMVLPALERGGYQYKKQVVIGKRLGGHNQKVDVLAWRVESGQVLGLYGNSMLVVRFVSI